jgi:ADP-heptose:LPS heptosyltransferase
MFALTGRAGVRPGKPGPLSRVTGGVALAAMRVLVLVPGRQVELLQASPVVRTLAAGLAGAEVTVGCSPEVSELALALEGCGEVLRLSALAPGSGPARWLGAWGRLRRRRFDLAVICGTSASARLLAYLAGVPRRVGPGGGLTAVLLSDRVPSHRHENRAASWVRCAEPLGIRPLRHLPRLRTSPAADRAALVQVHSSGIADGRLLVALAPGTASSDLPGAAAAATAWPPERWAHLANQMSTRHGAGILFVGLPEDQPAVGAAVVDVDAPYADLTGQLDTLGMAALLRQCDLVVGGDSPLLHLASAVGTPTVGLFGPTDGRRRGAYGVEPRVGLGGAAAGRPSTALLMARIRVEDVLAGIEGPL